MSDTTTTAPAQEAALLAEIPPHQLSLPGTVALWDLPNLRRLFLAGAAFERAETERLRAALQAVIDVGVGSYYDGEFEGEAARSYCERCEEKESIAQEALAEAPTAKGEGI